MELVELNGGAPGSTITSPTSTATVATTDRPNINTVGQHQQQNGQHQQIDNHSSSGFLGTLSSSATSCSSNNASGGSSRVQPKHRELPVDVPDTFIGMAKQSPRYPPPKPHRQISNSNTLTNTSTTNNNLPYQQQTASSPANQFNSSSSFNQNQSVVQTKSIVRSNLRDSVKLKQLESYSTNSAGQQQQFAAAAAVNQAYEPDDEQIQVPLPNASLRNQIQIQGHQPLSTFKTSQPIAATTSHPTSNGTNTHPHSIATNSRNNSVQNVHSAMLQSNNVVNEPGDNENGGKSSSPEMVPLPDFRAIYQRLQRNLNGEFADATNDVNLPKLLSLYTTVMQQQQQNKRYTLPMVLQPNSVLQSNFKNNSIDNDQPTENANDVLKEQMSNGKSENPNEKLKVADLLQTIIGLLREGNVTNETAELITILTKYEMDGLCCAFDRIVKPFDFTYTPAPAQGHSLQNQFLQQGQTPHELMRGNQNMKVHNDTTKLVQNGSQDHIQNNRLTQVGMQQGQLAQNQVQVGHNLNQITYDNQIFSPLQGHHGVQGHLIQGHNTQIHNRSIPLSPQFNNNHNQFHGQGDFAQQQQHQHQQILMNRQGVGYPVGIRPLMPSDMDVDPGQYVRIASIEKSSSQPLGATVRNENDRVVIGRIVRGGAAEKSGLLHEGDEILQVNGIEMKGKHINQVFDILNEMKGTLTFMIAARHDHHRGMAGHQQTGTDGQYMQNVAPSNFAPTKAIHLKALFDYDALNDPYIPCKELGISFCKGDILHVIDQSDPNWWQAHRDDNEGTLAGLIPSINFHIQRERILADSANAGALMHHNSGTGPGDTGISVQMNTTTASRSKRSPASILLDCGKGFVSSNHSDHHHSHQQIIMSPTRGNKPNKSLSGANIDPAISPTAATTNLNDEILTYEEVEIYYPSVNSKRPIVMVGPTNVGRQELRLRLLQDKSRFAAAIPHTTRPPRDGEKNGFDYHFVTKAQFESDIRAGRFVEHGEFERHYYGTAIDAIEAVVKSGKICVLNLHVPSILILRSSHAGAKLKPFFVFVKPPSNLEKLDRLVTSLKQQQQSITQATSPNELQKIVDEAQFILSHYKPYLDMVLPILDVDGAYEQLLGEIKSLERDPQWIPKFWSNFKN